MAALLKRGTKLIVKKRVRRNINPKLGADNNTLSIIADRLKKESGLKK